MSTTTSYLLFTVTILLLLPLLAVTTSQRVCHTIDREKNCTGTTRQLFILLKCPCNDLPSLEILLTTLTRDYNGLHGEIILFTDKDNTLIWNKYEKDGCGQLCPKATPTTSFEALLEVTIDILQSKRQWVELTPTNELHVIGISTITDHKTSHMTKERYHPLISLLLESCLVHQTTLHYLINPMGIASLLGDPLLSVTYSDHTHFNKALTLSKLISAGKEDTVQAHCLSRGLKFIISQYTPSLDPLSYSPIIQDPFPLNVLYKNECNTLLLQRECTLYCSPLHGCINEKNEELLVIEKPLLSNVEFKTSHAEYSTSTVWGSNNESLLLSILEPSPNERVKFTFNDVVKGQVEKVKWTSYEDLITTRLPVLLTGTDIDQWVTWNISYLSQRITDTRNVKCSNNYLTFDPDNKAPLKLNLSLSYEVKNVSSDLFFQCIQRVHDDSYEDSHCNDKDHINKGHCNNKVHCNDTYKGHYYFGEVPLNLKDDLKPNSFLYNTQEDYDKQRQYIWISSPGMITHGHFDQDYNLFIQLVGTKRFTLWLPSQHELLYTYPRVHPLWHKSRINFRDVNLDLFPNFVLSSALQVTVRPGDILYIPPYTWHYVETLSPSVSLSTWSHDYHMYHHMNAIYGHDHQFDLIGSGKGQMFALRLYLDMLVQDLYGFNETTRFFAKLLLLRFSGLENLFPPEEDDPLICEPHENSPRGEIPTCYHVHGFVKLDVQVIGSHFKSLHPEVMDILLADYIEEITTQIVGVNKLLAFFRYCFQGQNYYITSNGEEEHHLWDSPKV